MNKAMEKLTNQWQDTLNLVLGLWLIISPWVLAYTAQTTAAWTAHAVGVVILVMAALALYAFHTWEEWINVALAAWLIVSPWLLGYSAVQAATWNQIVVGLAVGVLALWSAAVERGTGVTARS
jgi:hypothetical protein